MSKCSKCKFFDYDEIWDGDEEVELFYCEKGHYDHIGWNVVPFLRNERGGDGWNNGRRLPT